MVIRSSPLVWLSVGLRKLSGGSSLCSLCCKDLTLLLWVIYRPGRVRSFYTLGTAVKTVKKSGLGLDRWLGLR